MRTIKSIVPVDNWKLYLTFDSGDQRLYDVKPLLDLEAFRGLRDVEVFARVHNRGYFIEWENDVDLSADTLWIEGQCVGV